ncbi:unnamed protein product [Ectocarpus fasciculatus]
MQDTTTRLETNNDEVIDVDAMPEKNGLEDARSRKLEIETAERAREDKFKEGDRSVFLPFLPLLFNGRTGNNGFCPVDIIDQDGNERDLVIISRATTTRFFVHEAPIMVSEERVWSFFFGKDIKRAQNLEPPCFIEAVLGSGFSVQIVGQYWTWNQCENTTNFIACEMQWFKQLLADVRRFFPERPTVRNFPKNRANSNYRSDGHGWGFLHNGKDKSTGCIDKIRMSLPYTRKMTMPVLGVEWAEEWYTPVVCRMFDIPAERAGKCHVVDGRVDCESSVKTLAEIRNVGKAKKKKRVKNRGRKRTQAVRKETKQKQSKKARKM